eukprot:scaffold96_cov172-Amphora_coffeaeformis.AAC.10
MYQDGYVYPMRRFDPFSRIKMNGNGGVGWQTGQQETDNLMAWNAQSIQNGLNGGAKGRIGIGPPG